MHTQFGLWNFDGQSVALARIARVKSIIALSSTESRGEFAGAGIYLLHLHENEGAGADQPFCARSGCVILWDGRLDNRPELVDALSGEVSREASEVEVVGAAYQRWGTNTFSKFVGDWALSIWNPVEHTLLLAKDFFGTRPLYYSTKCGSVSWSNLLDPLVLAGAGSPILSEEYIAGWFSRFPASHLTPYTDIRAVPPSSYVLFRDGSETVQTHWTFDRAKKISYGSSLEYEEHFREVFEKSVIRRLRSRAPVLAELSGGMDSSSIVCMADHVLSRGGAETPRLDTVSYYDDSEPDWDESPYFRLVEQSRGRTGLHLPINFRKTLHPTFPADSFAATPGSATAFSENDPYTAHLRAGQYRVLLQGLGGDEVLGGIPAPAVGLADLLAAARLLSFSRSLLSWALVGRIPVIRLLTDTARELLPISSGSDTDASVPWLRVEFIRRNRKALQGYEQGGGFAARPSFRANLFALEGLRRHVACLTPAGNRGLERRYVYLDRDLLEFLYAIPREQLIRPGQRRSLMRRALRGLVPPEILDRKRKAFISRAPIVAIREELDGLLLDTSQMVSSDLGIVDRQKFHQHLKQATAGQPVPIVPLLRTFLVEAWLRHISRWTDCRKYPFPISGQLHTHVYTPRDASYSLS
jgi:asparagine synthase (glutamine-hydrolysing)